jgi:AraC-like DNA-binding protein
LSLAILTMPKTKKLYKAAIPESQYRLRPNLFIWPDRTLIFGALQRLEVHAMGAVAINVGPYQPFFVKTGNGVQAFRCAIIPAGCKHEIIANGGILASLMIERHSPFFNSLCKRFPLQTSSVIGINDSEWITCFQQIYEDKPEKREIEQMLSDLLVKDEVMEKAIDSRIGEIMDKLMLDPLADTNQETLAASEGLSASRFRHLFTEQSAIPFQRYLMWRRVVSAMAALHTVDNLTYAAMEAGFTDSAHFNRCFRDTFGVNPSPVFKNIDRFEI